MNKKTTRAFIITITLVAWAAAMINQQFGLAAMAGALALGLDEISRVSAAVGLKPKNVTATR